MNTINQTRRTNLVSGYEPIPGYILEKPLGEGGFGEVWSARAPGGLQKAVKFVHGTMDEERAKRELKSLERIRGISHPFLLTLERFEFVDGRLAIVTELADGSLEDVYRTWCERGERGIPRETLLEYLYDAADALDYLNERFQLQHLDVKPGNFLMVGGHVKLADFGLLKDLGQVEQSMIGGLTPVYAAPEVFDGRPSGASDQYSLAVMYQELLTGTRPFEGKTIAQLATQHIHTAPNLESLPSRDRSLVAKALEKNPQRRYPTCRGFVKALLEVESASRGTTVEASGVSTVLEKSDSTSVPTETIESLVKELPRIRNSDLRRGDSVSVAQAVVVGLGGFGAEVLEKIHHSAAGKRLANGTKIEGLFLDTDLEEVERVRGFEKIEGALEVTSLATPLRTPHEYRLETTGRLSSISRRWLYNIPRSRRTEGLRPLGRLAMVDHADAVLDALRAVVQRVFESSQGTAPRVYVTASLSGGTGSGMVWDICFLTRNLLDSIGLADAEVIPLVVTPPFGKDSVGTSLHAADTYAALAELNHFLNPENSYPGDVGVGWEAVSAGRSPLSNTYVIASPTGLGEGVLAESIAKYILLGNGQAGEIIDAARQPACSEGQSQYSWETTVRSVGICPVQLPVLPDNARLAMASSVRAFRKCYGRPSEARQLGILIAEDWMKSMNLNAHSLLEDAWNPLSTLEHERWALLLRATQQCGAQALDPSGLDRIFEEVAKPLVEEDFARTAYVNSAMTRFIDVIRERLMEGQGDLTSFVEAVQQVIESIQSISEMHQLAGPRRLSEAAEVARIIRMGAKNHRSEEMVGTVHEPGPVLRYMELKLAAARDHRLVERLKELLRRLKVLKKTLRDRAVKVEGAIKHAQACFNKTNDGSGDPWRMLGQEGAAIREAVEVAATQYCWRSLVEIKSLESTLEKTSQQISERLQQVLISVVQRETDMLHGDADIVGADGCSLEKKLRTLNPRWLECGGGQRRFLVVGSEAQRELLWRRLPETVRDSYNVFIVDGAPAAFIHEAQQIPLGTILQRVELTAGSDPLVIGRLASRADLELGKRAE